MEENQPNETGVSDSKEFKGYALKRILIGILLAGASLWIFGVVLGIFGDSSEIHSPEKIAHEPSVESGGHASTDAAKPHGPAVTDTGYSDEPSTAHGRGSATDAAHEEPAPAASHGSDDEHAKASSSHSEAGHTETASRTHATSAGGHGTEASHGEPSHGEAAHTDASHGDVSHGTASHEEESHAVVSDSEASHGEASRVAVSHEETTHSEESPGSESHEEASHGEASQVAASNEEDSHGEAAHGEASHGEEDEGHGEDAHGAHGTVFDPNMPAGVAFIDATIGPLAHELNERWWGWRPNDVVDVTDNVNHFQLGVLEVTRRTAFSLAERISRTGSTAAFDNNLENAMNWFMIRADRYWFPSAESKYNDGLEELKKYRERLIRGEAKFYTRTDNLIPLLMAFEDLLGSCDENLVKHLEDDGSHVSYFSADDYFYYAQGVASAMHSILEAVQHDFTKVVESRRGTEVLHHAIVSCKEAVEIGPILILNSGSSSIFANHRANIAAPISHARFYVGVLIKTLST